MRQLALISCLAISLQSYAVNHMVSTNECTSGLTQSPVDIALVEEREMPSLNFIYQTVDMHVFNDMPTNYFAYPDDNLVLEIDSTRYPLTDIHIHNPSEHRINGNQFPLEIHFVHTSVEGEQIIVAQFAEFGKNNPALSTLLTNFARGAVQIKETSIKFALNPADLMAPFHGYYTYTGSTTYGSCMQDVTWYILKDIIEINKSQADQIRRMTGVNSRIPQPLNGRVIYSTPVAQQ